MTSTPQADLALAEETLVNAIAAVLGSFLRATEALNRAIDSNNGIAMCDALERLGDARRQALRLVDR